MFNRGQRRPCWPRANPCLDAAERTAICTPPTGRRPPPVRCGHAGSGAVPARAAAHRRPRGAARTRGTGAPRAAGRLRALKRTVRASRKVRVCRMGRASRPVHVLATSSCDRRGAHVVPNGLRVVAPGAVVIDLVRGGSLSRGGPWADLPQPWRWRNHTCRTRAARKPCGTGPVQPHLAQAHPQLERDQLTDVDKAGGRTSPCRSSSAATRSCSPA
jgi:hypothetical protein